jgi:hypothetical protein
MNISLEEVLFEIKVGHGKKMSYSSDLRMKDLDSGVWV